MFNYKAMTYQPMEKPKQEKKFKQNSYEEIRKLVEDNEGNEIVKNINNKKKNKSENNNKFSLKWRHSVPKIFSLIIYHLRLTKELVILLIEEASDFTLAGLTYISQHQVIVY